MRAAILAVGSELLGTDRLDTNSLKLTALLERYGVELRRKAVVGDSEQELADEIGRLMGGYELVLVTGGLGPTADDLTREAVAGALGRRLVDSPELEIDLRAKFARFGMRMPEVNLRQTKLVEGAECLANPRGTAPGQRLESRGCTLFLFPGVPAELDGLMESALEPWLRAATGGAALATRVLRVACVAESALEERIGPAYEEFGREAISVLASAADIQVRLTAAGPEAEREARLEEMSRRVGELIGDALYARSAEQTLERVVGEELRRAGLTLATAESCTGGLVARRLTEVPGSSDYFVGGVVTYADRLKSELLGVSAALLAAEGAVSEPVVRQMAEGARARLGADLAVAVSGVAGPGGGTEAKPVGTVHLAVAGPEGAETGHRRLRLPGSRRRVRRLASQWALELVRRRLLALAAAGPGAADEAPRRRVGSGAAGR